MSEPATGTIRAGKLGALLLQMTLGLTPCSSDLSELESILRQLRDDGKEPRQVVLELRHHDWLYGRHRSRPLPPCARSA